MPTSENLFQWRKSGHRAENSWLVNPLDSLFDHCDTPFSSLLLFLCAICWMCSSRVASANERALACSVLSLDAVLRITVIFSFRVHVSGSYLSLSLLLPVTDFHALVPCAFRHGVKFELRSGENDDDVFFHNFCVKHADKVMLLSMSTRMTLALLSDSSFLFRAKLSPLTTLLLRANDEPRKAICEALWTQRIPRVAAVAVVATASESNTQQRRPLITKVRMFEWFGFSFSFSWV